MAVCFSRLPLLLQGLKSANRRLHRVVSTRCLSGGAGIDGPYTSPSMNTEVPGPRSKELLAKLDKVTLSKTISFFTDYERSRGNYIVDADGNVMLDTFCQIASLPLGYNHHAIIEAVTKKSNLSALINRPALGLNPPVDYVERLNNCLISIAPDGMSEVVPMMCGTCANENAIKTACISVMTKRRGGEPPTQEELQTAVFNQAPGSPQLSVLSFQGAFHGRALGTLSCTHTKPIFKLDIPSFHWWPVAPFPQLKYPLEAFESENAAEERRCLEEVEDLIVKKANEGHPVGALIIEPIQAEGGDKHASADFFRNLRDICLKRNIPMIVDEVQTGLLSTGTMWAHDAWKLSTPPEFVTFSKKMQIGGYYQQPQERPAEAYRIYNTWMGDPSRMIVLEAILREVEKEGLQDVVRTTGSVLLAGLKELQDHYPALLHSARGVGTFCAIDSPTPQIRDQIVTKMRNKGFQCGGSGDCSLRFRPALIFTAEHANMFLNGLETVLKECS